MNFLKNLFGLGKKEDVELSKAEAWLDNYFEEDLKNLKGTIAEYYQRIEDRKKELEEKLEKLKTAKVEGKTILREVQFMEGNREAYEKKLKIFLQDIQLPEKNRYGEIIEHYSLFEDDLNEFGKNTIKSYSILREFFDKIATDIARDIKDIEKSLEYMVMAIEKSRIMELEKIKNKIHAINRALETREEMIQNIKEKRRNIKEQEDRKLKTEKELETLKKSSAYKKYLSELREKETVLEEISKEKNNILQLFAGLDKALKKYKRGALNEKIIDLYLENPNNAVLEDEQFEIVDVLDKLKKLVEEDKLELEDKKKEKTLQTIDAIHIDLLIEKRKRILELHANLKEKEHILSKNPAILNYKDLEYKLEHIQSMLREDELSISKLEQNRDKIVESELKKELEKDINDIARIKINII